MSGKIMPVQLTSSSPEQLHLPGSERLNPTKLRLGGTEMQLPILLLQGFNILA
jgi:hypothetical protein